MSRSYKKTPYQGQKQNRENKRLSNKAVRRVEMLGNGGDYKRVYNSYNIRDYGNPVFDGERIDADSRRELYKWITK